MAAKAKAQATGPPMEEVRYARTDFPPKQRKPIRDAVQLFYHKHVKKGDAKRPKTSRWSDFAKELKESLDGNLGPHWHVLVGTQLGFACKNRKGSMAVLRVQECMVVLWQSPGLEEPSPVDVAAADAPAADPSGEEAAGAAAADAARTLEVLEPPAVEVGSDHERVVAILREEFCGASENTQALAQAVRKRLTAELGTIWHVVTGTEFVAEAAEDVRNYVLAHTGKRRIVCFQHEQFCPRKVNFDVLMSALPYLFALFFCLGYMTMNSLCGEEVAPDRTLALKMKAKLCHGDWENKINMLGFCAMASLFMTRKSSLLGITRMTGKQVMGYGKPKAE